MDDTVNGYRIQAQVEPERAGMRLDAYWVWKLGGRGVSRNRIRQWIRQSRARINDCSCTKPAREVQSGEILILDLPQEENGISPRAEPIQIIWQDQDVAVINKPPGLSVHPAPSQRDATLVNRLVHHFPHLKAQDECRPGIVHRLDKDTSGLLLVALREDIRTALSRSLAAREVEKEYLALVHGCPDPRQAWIEEPLGRDRQRRTRMAVQEEHGRSAQTWYQVLYAFDHIPCSLLRVRIVTGRTHQIRVHLAHRGHAVVGDRTYGPQQTAALERSRPIVSRAASRQMLHAWRLGFRHPHTGEWLSIRQGVPKDFLRVLLQSRRRPQRVGITGGVGCGKSALTALTAENRIPVWSADQAVAELYAPGADGWEMLKRSFGQEFVPDESGPVDKKALFAAMQSSPEKRQAVLDIVHPLVEHSWQMFCERHEQARVVLAEVPLLFEGRWKERSLVDVAVNVHAPAQIRRQRLADNRGWTPEVIERMQAWQMPDAEKLQLADVNIPNAGSWAELEQAAAGLKRTLLARRRQKVHEFLSWLRSHGVI